MLRRAGIEVTRYPAPNTLPWQTKQVIRRLGIEGVVDVGAHEGEYVRMLRDVVGYDGPVVSFEPLPSSFHALVRDRRGDGAWTGRNVALGSEAGTLSLNLYTGTDFNSFLRQNDYGRARFAPLLEAGTQEVPVRRLDQVLEMSGTLLLKSDTQGYDLEVIEGAAGLIDRVAAITVELPLRPIYEGAPALPHMLERMTTWGFELIGLFPLSRDGLRVVEFDGIFVRAELGPTTIFGPVEGGANG